VSRWCGAGCRQPPRLVKTARQSNLCSIEQREARACLGLDRRGRMNDPAPHAGAGLAQQERCKIPLDKQHSIFEGWNRLDRFPDLLGRRG